MDFSFDLQQCQLVMHETIRSAGEIITKAFGNRCKEIDEKSSEIDLVTKSDKMVEEYIFSNFSKHFPNFKSIGEESVGEGLRASFTDEPTWVVDPIDGTMNFIHSFPNVAISVALLVNKKPVLGVIYNPVLNQFFEAKIGEGSRLNGEKITVSSQKDVAKSLIAYEFGTSREPDKQKNVLENVTSLMPKVHGIRSLGSAALNMAMVALGAADAYVEFGIHCWDVAAGWLIVKEAGGVIVDPAGGEFDLLNRRVMCAGTQQLVDGLVPLITQFYPPED